MEYILVKLHIDILDRYYNRFFGHMVILALRFSCLVFDIRPSGFCLMDPPRHKSMCTPKLGNRPVGFGHFFSVILTALNQRTL